MKLTDDQNNHKNKEKIHSLEKKNTHRETVRWLLFVWYSHLGRLNRLWGVPSLVKHNVHAGKII